MFEQAFRNIDDVLWKEAGCTTELDYTEQTSWLLFLKYLDGLERDRADEAKLDGKRYTFLLDKPYRWESWAAPKGADGKLDHNAALAGDDLRDFVDLKLFPYLQGFKQKAAGANTLEYKIGEIFGEIKNKIQSGYNLREIIDHIDELRFRSQIEKHELSALYEEKIKRMGNAGRNGGEYYTPRPLIRAMIDVTAPQLGEKIYDGACGSAGFLCESFDYLVKAHPHRTTAQDKAIQERTFYGKEKKSLAYVIAIMNLILHGIEAPNIVHANTLSENLADIQDKDRFDIVLANPPFGGKERPEVQQNFPIRTGETAFLFLQHFIKILKAGGRGAIVIKNTFLSNTDNASVSLRKQEEADIYALNRQGDLVIFELKRDSVGGGAVHQALRYCEKSARFGYEQLEAMFRKYRPDAAQSLREEHRQAFELELPLEKSAFNHRQRLMIVGSAGDEELIRNIDYWKSRGLWMDFVPYRIYQIGGDYFFEFFSLPYDRHSNPGQTKGVLFDTNRSYDHDAIWYMCEQSRVAAFGDIQGIVQSFNKGDTVFLYHKGHGIVAAGEVRGPVEADGAHDARYRKVKWLTPVPCRTEPIRALSPSEITDVMKFGFYWAKTMKPPYLNAEESGKLLKALLQKFV